MLILDITRSTRAELDATTGAGLAEWLAARLVGRRCTSIKVRIGAAIIQFVDADGDVDWLWTGSGDFTLFDGQGVPVLDYHSGPQGDRADYEVDNDATDVLEVLLGTAIAALEMNVNTLTLMLGFDNGLNLMVWAKPGDVYETVPHWEMAFPENVWLRVGPGRGFEVEYPDDPLPPPPYRLDKLVEVARLAGPDRGGRYAFAHEAHTVNDLAPVRAVLRDVLGQPFVSSDVSVHQRQFTLHFGQPRVLHIPRSQRTFTSGDWSIGFTDVPIALHHPDGWSYTMDEPWPDDAPNLYARLMGTTLTQADVLLSDLGLVLTFSDGTVLTAHPTRDLVNPPSDYRWEYWRVATPDRPERLLDVGPGRSVSYLLVPGRW